jgi:hypothetical protein
MGLFASGYSRSLVDKSGSNKNSEKRIRELANNSNI